MVSIYADPYHPISPRLPKSSVMRGIAVAMMVRSSATRKMAMKLESMTSQKRRLLGWKFLSGSPPGPCWGGESSGSGGEFAVVLSWWLGVEECAGMAPWVVRSRSEQEQSGPREWGEVITSMLSRSRWKETAGGLEF